MEKLPVKLGWGTTTAALIGGALLLSRYTGPAIAMMAGSVAAGAVHKLRDKAGLLDSTIHAAPGVALGAGGFLLG